MDFTAGASPPWTANPSIGVVHNIGPTVTGFCACATAQTQAEQSRTDIKANSLIASPPRTASWFR
jgi:hypothetical protein